MATFLPAYVLLSHLPVNFFLYPQNGFGRILSVWFFSSTALNEYVVNEDFVRRVGEDESDEDDPLVIKKHLMKENINLYKVWMEPFHMTDFDYQQQDNYEHLSNIMNLNTQNMIGLPTELI